MCQFDDKYWIYLEFSAVMFTQERIDKLTELSQMPDIYERLSRALGKYDYIFCKNNLPIIFF